MWGVAEADKDVLDFNALFSGHSLRIGGPYNQSSSRLEAHPALPVSATERRCVQGLGAVSSLDVQHMTHSFDIVV